MKPRILATARLSLPLASALTALLAAPAAQATVYYWDVNGTTSGFSTVVGAWNGTNVFWNEDATGGAGGPTTTATTLITDDLNFVAATTNTGSITLSTTQNAQSLTYGSTVGAITLTGGTLNLAAAATITTNSVVGTVHSIASTISGAGTSLTKAGVGTLALTHTTNTFNPGEIIISGGVLRIGNGTATQLNGGTYTGNISIAAGSTLQLWSSSAQTFSTGVISGDGGINKAYGGTLTLSGANTYTGKSQFLPQTTAGFTVNVSSFNSVVGGTASSSLGAPTTVANGTIDVGDGGKQASVTLNYVSTAPGETTDRVINLAFNGTSNQTIQASNSTGVLRFTSAFTSNTGTSGKLFLGGAGAGQIDQGLPQLPTGGLEKTGAGTWTLGGSGNFTGATLIAAAGGTLSLSSATALQNSPFNTASVAGGAAAGLKIATTTLTLGGLTGSNALRGRFTTALGGPSSATVQGGYDGLTNLTLNTVAGSNSSYSGAIAEGATGMSLTKTGAGIQTLTGVNGYTGTTSVNAGFLTLSGSTLAGGLSVTNAGLGSNSTFAGLATVTSGVIAPGASLGAIGTLTINNASASALTLGGSSTGIFDLPSTVTTPDRIAVTGGGGLVLNGTNTVLLQTAITGTPAGTYDLMTFTGAHTGAGSLVFANGSTTRGNATLSVSAGLVQVTVAAGGLAGTSTFTGAGGTGATDLWNIAARWNSGVVPTGTTNITLAPTGTQGVVVNAATPTYSGDLMINPGVALQLGWTTAVPTAYNALGTPGTTIIFMGAGSQIRSRNASSGTFSDIMLLGDANVSLGESTQTGMAATFRSITGPYAFSLYTHGIGGAAGSANFTMANSFTTLNLSGSSTSPLTASAANSIGTATVNMSLGVKMILNTTGAMADSANVIRIDNGTLEQGNGAGVTAALSLPTRAIELNGAGQATINNANTTAARTMTLGGGISSTATGAKILTLGGANTGDNTISGAIIDGAAGSIALTKADAGKWVLSGTNTYTGATTINGGTLRLANTFAVQNSSGVTLSGAAAGTLQLGTDTAFSAFPAITGPSAQPGTIVSDRATLGAALTHALGTANFGNNTFNITQGSLVNSGTAGISFTSITMGGGSGGSVTLNPTTANLTIVGNATSANTGTHTLFLGGTSTGNSIGGVIDEGAQRTTQIVTVNNTGAWTLSGNNTYSGLTTVAGSATLTLSGNNSGAAGGVTLSTAGTGSTTPRLNLNSATALGTGTLNFGGGLASDTVRLDNTSAGLVTVTTNNAFTLNRNFTFIGTQSLDLGNMTTTLGGMAASTNRSISVTANTLTFGGSIGEGAVGNGVTKSGAGTLVFKGTGSLYAGTTVVSGGTFAGIGTNAFGNTSGISIAGAGTLSLRGDSNTSFVKTTGGAAYSVSTSASDATINVDQATIAGTAAKTMTIGTLGTTSTAATYEINFTGANNTSLSMGAVTGAASTAIATVAIDNNIASTGMLTLASYTSANTTGGETLTFKGTGNTTVTGAITPSATTLALTKTGAGTLTLEGTNTYTGATLVNAGTLLINGDNTAAIGAVTVASGATLGGTGQVGGDTTIQSGGTHAPGVAQDNQDFNGDLTYSSGSIFGWEIDTASTNTDSVTGTASGDLSGVGAVFNITSSTGYSDGFWNTNQQWTDIFSGFATSDNWDDIFTSISGTGLTWDGSQANAGTEGYFTLTSTSLDWTAVPEPTSALAGLLIGAGLLRRRRN